MPSLKDIAFGVAFGLLAIWLRNNSPTATKITGPMGAGGTPLLPF